MVIDFLCVVSTPASTEQFLEEVNRQLSVMSKTQLVKRLRTLSNHETVLRYGLELDLSLDHKVSLFTDSPSQDPNQSGGN